MYEDWESFVKENEAGITGKFSPDPCTLLISMQHIQLCLVVLKITNDKKEKKKKGFFWVLEKKYCLYSNKRNP